MPSVWRRSVRKTYNEHFKPPTLRPIVKQEKNEYLPNRQTCRTAKSIYTLSKQEERKFTINDKFASRWAQIVSRQRQEVRAKSTTITHQNSLQWVLSNKLFCNQSEKKEQISRQFSYRALWDSSKVESKKPLTSTLQRYLTEPSTLGYQGPRKSFSCGRHSTISLCKPLGKNACSLE